MSRIQYVHEIHIHLKETIQEESNNINVLPLLNLLKDFAVNTLKSVVIAQI